MNDNFIIRNMTEKDFPDLDNYFGTQTIYKKAKDHWINYLKDHENKIRIVQVVELNNHVIGFGTLKFKSDYQYFFKNNIPEINDILVAPEFRRKGIGKELVKSFEHVAKQNDFPQIGLAVGLYKDYGSAQRLYAKLGYIPDGHGITYRNEIVTAGDTYPVDDDLLLWLIKSL